MKTVLSLLAFAAVLVGAGHLVLRLFSGLSGVDMPAACRWGFAAKRLELVLPMLLFLLMGIVFTLVLVRSPVTLLEAATTNRGGLAGYRAGEGECVYFDPARKIYERVPYSSPPPAPARWTRRSASCRSTGPSFRDSTVARSRSGSPSP